MCIHAHVPIYQVSSFLAAAHFGTFCLPLEASSILCYMWQITAKDEYSPLCTFLETLLTMIW